MKVQVQTSVLFILFISAWVDCTGVPSCATMRTWFPETNPIALADNLPYDLSVSGRYPGQSVPAYIPNSTHTVYLNGSYLANEMRMRNFLGFIISAENSVKAYPNGYFENLPAGVEQINCSTLKVVQNSTSSGNWTSIKLQWRAPESLLAGNITFRASALQQTDPLWYFEGFTAHLTYDCPLLRCAFPCPQGSYYMRDSYGCQTCQCGGPCANMTCPFYGYCVANQTTAQCKCDIVCIEIYAPVCGTDGKTYGNDCHMRRQACIDQKNITVCYKGECSAAGNLGSSFLLLCLALVFLMAFL